MNSDLGSLSKETTPERIASYIKPLSTMNEVIDKFLDSCKTLFEVFIVDEVTTI